MPHQRAGDIALDAAPGEVVQLAVRRHGLRLPHFTNLREAIARAFIAAGTGDRVPWMMPGATIAVARCRAKLNGRSVLAQTWPCP
jgi:hypothetical protein